MRTPAAVRALLAGVAVVVSPGASHSDSPVDKFIANPSGDGEFWTGIFLEHQLASIPMPASFQLPARPVSTPDTYLTSHKFQGERPKQAGHLQGPGGVLLPASSLDRDDSKAADSPRATPTTDDAGGPLPRMAEFEIPPSTPKRNEQIPELPKQLEYQYAYGSESEIIYRANPDLDDAVRDNSFILIPQVNGYVTYRPVDWLETTLELIFEREIAAHEEDSIVLPNGDIKLKQKRRFSMLVDQAFVTIKGFTDPFEFTVGRKNFEDARHWLYDTSMDVALVTLKHGMFRTQAVLGREVLVDLDAFQREPTDKIDTYMLETEYRGIEDIKIAAYGIYRTDHSHEEGERWLMGVRSHGMPTDEFNYWTELAYLHGRDSQALKIAAFAVDVGATYRLTEVPWMPNATLGFALGSGDDNPSDWKNNDFRQTGLESNEVKFAGLTEFKGYGEVFDPELSNLKILTVGAGVRPAPNISVDLVYHRYWLDKFTDALNNTALTAEVNQVDAIRSKDVGSGLDLVVGIRSLFNIQRLDLDVRAGLFFPNRAYLIDEMPPRDADTGSAVVVKFWW